MLMMSKPRKAHKDEDPAGLLVRGSGPSRAPIRILPADVEAERELFARLQPLSPSEQALWVLDATINQRGFCVDRDLAEAARKIAKLLPDRRSIASSPKSPAALLRASIRSPGCRLAEAEWLYR